MANSTDYHNPDLALCKRKLIGMDVAGVRIFHGIRTAGSMAGGDVKYSHA
ncbi:hypothetical protein [Pedobacter mendelii]|nr:hypothetical protein [Pedobacter mendelii]